MVRESSGVGLVDKYSSKEKANQNISQLISDRYHAIELPVSY